MERIKCRFDFSPVAKVRLIPVMSRFPVNHVRFNGRLSQAFHTGKAIPQGSPLSPYVCCVYVSDIFATPLRYTRPVRQVVSSYVDDSVIHVAPDHGKHTMSIMEEIFKDCDRIGRLRGMGFSMINTKWIGFGDRVWDAMIVNGVSLEPMEELRVLCFYFNVANNFSSHVNYWLGRGLMVRRRIGALGRRFGRSGGIDAFGIFRLI